MTNPNQPGSYNQGAPKKEPRDQEEMKSKKNPNDRDEEEVSDESDAEEAE